MFGYGFTKLSLDDPNANIVEMIVNVLRLKSYGQRVWLHEHFDSLSDSACSYFNGFIDALVELRSELYEYLLNR